MLTKSHPTTEGKLISLGGVAMTDGSTVTDGTTETGVTNGTANNYVTLYVTYVNCMYIHVLCIIIP